MASNATSRTRPVSSQLKRGLFQNALQKFLQESVTKHERLADEVKIRLEEARQEQQRRQQREKEARQQREEMERQCKEMDKLRQEVEEGVKKKLGSHVLGAAAKDLPEFLKYVGGLLDDGILDYEIMAPLISQKVQEVVDKMKALENTEKPQKEDIKRVFVLMDHCLELLGKDGGKHFPHEIITRLIVNGKEETDPTSGKMADVMVRAESGGEVQLLLDQSGSIGSGVWEKQLVPAVNKFIDAFRDDQPGRLKLTWGALAYGEIQTIGDKMKGEAMKSAVNLHTYKGGGTPTAEAIEMAIGRFAEGSLRMIVNFTDGKPDNRERAKRQFEEANKREIIVVGIGIGSGIEEGQLKQMSTSGFVINVLWKDCKHIFILRGFAR